MTSDVSDPTAAASAPHARGDARRRQLVETTAKLASRNGIVGTSVKDIAHAAGVAPGLVHHYFTSKEELVVAVVARLEDSLRSTWLQGVDTASDPLERLVAGLDAIAADVDDHPEQRRLLADLAVTALSSPAVQERMSLLWRRVAADIEGEVRQVLGALPAYALASPHDLAAVISGTIDGIALQTLVCGDAPRPAMHTLVVVVLSVVAAAYLVTGEQPPLERLRTLAARGAPATA